MSKTFKCNKCGKEFSYDSPALENWAATRAKPEQIKCPDCFGNNNSNSKSNSKSVANKTNTEAVSKPSYKKPVASKAQQGGKTVMSAELLKQKYDELCAVFSDDLDSVKDYLGGWTTTLALSETR